MLETINTVPILRLFSQFRVSPGNAVIKSGNFCRSLYVYDHPDHTMDPGVRRFFPRGKRGGDVGRSCVLILP